MLTGISIDRAWIRIDKGNSIDKMYIEVTLMVKIASIILIRHNAASVESLSPHVGLFPDKLQTPVFILRTDNRDICIKGYKCLTAARQRATGNRQQ